RPGFEGGQMPLYMRIPKLRGFTSKRTPASVIYTGQLDAIGKTTVDNKVLADAGLTESPYVRVKLVLKGDVTRKVTVKLQGCSRSAIAAVTKAGGSFEAVDQIKRPAISKRSKKV
ncbi:MAG: uL15 family ribosomal protein, partial [Candidatus Saccharimonadales bacterium]